MQGLSYKVLGINQNVACLHSYCRFNIYLVCSELEAWMQAYSRLGVPQSPYLGKIAAGDQVHWYCLRDLVFSYDFKFKPASSLTSYDAPVSEQMRKQTTHFSDENRGETGGFSAHPYAPPSMSQQSLGEFLKRPVQIATYNWKDTDAIGNLMTNYPWLLWAQKTSVKNKLANYAFLRGNLKLKIMLNASPFYYGAALASYRLWPGGKADTTAWASTTSGFMPLSQRPHAWLYASTSAGGEITLPFIWHRDWLRINLATDFSDIGEFRIDSVTGLFSVNSTGTPTGANQCFIQVFAWMEDVEVSGPTVGLTLQAEPEDEYGKGIVSAPASAVAAVAGRLAGAPVIGRLATATQIGATAAGRIASLFGFSNTPNLRGESLYTQKPFPSMAAVGLESAAEKLTLDPKNELTIDPKSIGVPVNDELNIQYLVQKESFLTEFTWNTSDAVDKVLFTSRVNPRMYATDTIVNGTEINQTPMSFVSNLFNNWKGDIIFKFVFVCTQYHKGRVIVSFDPTGTTTSNLTNQVETSGQVQTAIVDLGINSEVEFRVPYQQSLPWLRMQSALSAANLAYTTSNAPTWNYVPDYDNGMISIRVFTELTAPNTTLYNGVPVMVFVRGAENLEFANPGLIQGHYSYFRPQSEPEVETVDLGSTAEVKGRELMNFGEKITSLRELFQRRCHALNVVFKDPGNDYVIYNMNLSRIPMYWGYDPNGISVANKNASGTYNFNFSYMTPLNWILPAFVGVRGSVEWTYNWVAAQPASSVRISRNPFYSITPAAGGSSGANYGANVNVLTNWLLGVQLGGDSGMAVTTQLQKGPLSVIVPYYSPMKFHTTNVSNPTAPQPYDMSNYDTFQCNVIYSQVPTTDTPSKRDGFMQFYTSIGTDFLPIFFLNVPTIFLYNWDPVPTP